MNKDIRLVGLFTLLVFLGISVMATTNVRQSSSFEIRLKAKAQVLGPRISLQDISIIKTSRNKVVRQLLSVQLGDAAPPGESKEITLSDIKRCLIRAGFKQYVRYLKGPRSIRVTTAQIEIDKAFVHEEFASLGRRYTSKIKMVLFC